VIAGCSKAALSTFKIAKDAGIMEGALLERVEAASANLGLDITACAGVTSTRADAGGCDVTGLPSR
jgi:hypothetical protein